MIQGEWSRDVSRQHASGGQVHRDRAREMSDCPPPLQSLRWFKPKSSHGTQRQRQRQRQRHPRGQHTTARTSYLSLKGTPRSSEYPPVQDISSSDNRVGGSISPRHSGNSLVEVVGSVKRGLDVRSLSFTGSLEEGAQLLIELEIPCLRGKRKAQVCLSCSTLLIRAKARSRCVTAAPDWASLLCKVGPQ